MSDGDAKYNSFLKLLDNSQLIAHINSFSEVDVASRKSSVLVTSTPNVRKVPDIFSSIESNPFDDNLDSVLLRLGKLQSSVLDGPVHGNQLALLDTDEDEEESVTHQRSNESEARRRSNESGTQQRSNETESAGPPLEFSGAIGAIVDADVLQGGDGINSQVLDNLENDSQEDQSADETTFAEVGPQHKFGDYATYFENKYRKQQLADVAYLEWERKRRLAQGEPEELPRIFEGCVIYVNGNTIPTIGVVHRMVILHGGKFIHYLNNKSAATHIICDRLTPRKKVEYRNFRVVKAQWIAHCVEQQKLLDWREYRLIDVVDVDQKRLGFLPIKDRPRLPIKDGSLPSKGSPGGVPPVRKDTSEVRIPVDEAVLPKDIAEDFDDDDPFSDSHLSEPELENELQPAGVANEWISQLNIAKSRLLHTQMDAKHPDFLKHFFANSRLHHLSTWKANLRSKFLRLVATKTPPQKSQTSGEHVILHIDFDCFFATASTLARPDLDINVDPIAVSHGGKSSDVASCNYVARKSGVRNGMWLGGALEACPSLNVLDYDFQAYERHSNSFYKYLVSKGIFDSIFPVLIDEVLVDATTFCHQSELLLVDVVDSLSKEIRADILAQTGCPVSIGIGSNVLLAKLAIKMGKPDGYYYLHENVDQFLEGTTLRDLPGVGYRMCEKLEDELGSPARSITIGEVKKLSLQKLCTILGEKTGAKIYDNCRGKDSTSIALDLNNSEVLLGRKTVSVDVNFGIRFDNFNQAEYFLMELAKELHSRLIDLGVCGSALSLKLARRAPGAPVNPPKYLGMGRCDFFSKSSRMGVPTNDWGIIGSEMKSLFRMLNVPVEELRGVAVSMSKLEDVESVKKQRQLTLQFNNPPVERIPVKQNSQENPFSERVTNIESIDWDVFNQLPEDIRRELRHELRQRGIPVSRKERSPTKEDLKRNGTKIYYQQLFPSQPNGEFKHVRILESPSKKKRRMNESPLKVKEQKRSASPTPYNESISYDENVLNEIPSSIRKEFMEELSWQKKNKKLVFVSMKQKLEQKQMSRQQMIEKELTSEWLEAQPRLIELGEFGSLSSNSSERKDQLQMWVQLSMEEEGPHPDDVKQFGEHITAVAERGCITLSADMLKVLDVEIRKHETLFKLGNTSQSFYGRALQDWRDSLQILKTTLLDVCRRRNIEIDL